MLCYRYPDCGQVRRCLPGVIRNAWLGPGPELAGWPAVRLAGWELVTTPGCRNAPLPIGCTQIHDLDEWIDDLVEWDDRCVIGPRIRLPGLLELSVDLCDEGTEINDTLNIVDIDGEFLPSLTTLSIANTT